MSASQPEVRRRFPGLDPMALQHPYDRAALSALQRVRGGMSSYANSSNYFLNVLPISRIWLKLSVYLPYCSKRVRS